MCIRRSGGLTRSPRGMSEVFPSFSVSAASISMFNFFRPFFRSTMHDVWSRRTADWPPLVLHARPIPKLAAGGEASPANEIPPLPFGRGSKSGRRCSAGITIERPEERTRSLKKDAACFSRENTRRERVRQHSRVRLQSVVR